MTTSLTWSIVLRKYSIRQALVLIGLSVSENS